MKKVKKPYKTSTVHPSPPPPPPISTHLALLPATILTLTLTLSQEDKEILAYLLSIKFKTTTTSPTHHSPPLFNCTCFTCYLTYWVRWDSSPNRHVIHQIIDAVEDDALFPQTHHKKTKKYRKKKPFSNIIITNNNNITTTTNNNDNEREGDDGTESTRSMEVSQHEFESVECEEEEEEEEGMMRKMVSFFGERIWSVWT